MKKINLHNVKVLYYIDDHKVRKRYVTEVFGEREVDYGYVCMYKSINRRGTLYDVVLRSEKLGIEKTEQILVTNSGGIYGKHIRYYADLDDMLNDANKRLTRYTYDAKQYHDLASMLDSRVYFTNKLLENIENTKAS